MYKKATPPFPQQNQCIMHFFDKIKQDGEDIKENDETKNSFQTNTYIHPDQSKREGQKFAIYGGQKTGHGQQSSPYGYSESSLKVHSSVKDDEHHENEYNRDEHNADEYNTDEYSADEYNTDEHSDDEYNDEDYSENDVEHDDDDEDDYNDVDEDDRKRLKTKPSKRNYRNNKEPSKPRRKISKR